MRLEVALRDYTPCAQQGVTVNMYYTLPTGFSALDVTLAERAHTSSQVGHSQNPLLQLFSSYI